MGLSHTIPPSLEKRCSHRNSMELGSDRARKFRRRAADDDEDNQNDDSNATTTTTTTTTARPTNPKPEKLLSFADDEDSAETPSSCSTTASRSKRTSNSSSCPTKPSSSSGHKITTLRDRQSHSSTTSSTLSNFQPQTGTYTKEALLKLQKNSRILCPSRPASSELVIVLNDDEDDEEKIWEEEQFRKGLGKRMDDGTSRVAVTASSVVPVVQSVQQQQQKFVYPSMPSVSGGPSIGGAIGVSQGLDAMISIPQQAEIAKKALQDNVRRLKESHGRTISSLTNTDENLTASYANITALGKSLSVANEKFIFMQKLRQFVSVICDFLQHPTNGCIENEVEPKYQNPDYDDQPKAENHTGEVMDNNDVQAEEDPKWWDSESRNILDSQQLVEALCLCDDIFQSQSPNRDGNGNDGAGKGKLRLSDYAQLGPEDLKNAKTLSLIQQTLNLIHHHISNLASLTLDCRTVM